MYAGMMSHAAQRGNRTFYEAVIKDKGIFWWSEGVINLKYIEVKVFENDLEKAMRILKKKIQNDGLFKRLKLKKSYEKPSERERRKQREALRRQRIAASRGRHGYR